MGTNTGIGIGIGIPFRNNALGGDNIYFPPELKARMIGVWDNYGKKNTDADRNIIKNKIPNAGGDLEILNAAYEGMSGYNGYYPVVFGANETWENLSSYSYTSDVTSTTIHITRVKNAGTGLLFSYVKKDGALTNIREIPAFRVTVKGLEGNSKFGYRYLATEDATIETLVYLGNGTHELSKSFTPTEALLDLTRNAWVGIFITPMVEGEVVFDCDITIEVLPEYEGAFVTDGVNDMIISQKTIAEMGITDEVTIVSMIHQITLNSTYGNGFTNYIENLDKSTYVRNNIYKAGKTGIYGYSVSLINRTGSNINNILGDKNDYGFEVVNRQNTLNASKLSIIGRATGFNEISSIAHYWTFAVLGKATADEINLIIAKYNLDRTLRPDILCNITKQGITNDNHADFNDKLIDYSGNGRDIQMYNLAWKGGSGIASKQYETFKDWTSESSSTSIIKQIDEFTRIVESTTNGYWVSRIKRDYDLDKVYDPINVYLYQDNNFLVHECKYEVDGVKYAIPINEPVGKGYHKLEMFTKDRYTELPENAENVVLSEWYFPKSTKGSIKYSIIPSCKGGILLDGINDFGKVTGMPVYKDYTFIIDYERISYASSERWVAGVVSKSHVANQGAFILMIANTEVEPGKQAYSFGGVTSFNRDDFTRALLYQSKYKCGDVDLTVGEGVDSDTLWLGTFRRNDQRFFNGAIYSLMSFPYSMSEFLIERQLKKHKLGTLYPDMVEFRPVIKANDNYKIFYTAMLPLTGDIWERINIGDYVPVGRRIAIQMSFDNEAKKLVSAVSSQLGNITIIKNSNNIGYTIFGDVLKDKSPQKISITIEQDENYVLFNPVINSNYDNYKLTFHLREYEKLINIGDYIPKGTYIRANLYLKNNIDELVTFTFNGVNIDYAKSPVLDTAYNIRQIYNYDSPQEVNITIDEYIRYEDIVQPYPVLLRFNDENGNEVSWGGKFRVGSTITRIGSIADPESNLLNGLYSVSGLSLNGKAVTSSTNIVEKQMVFKTTATYLLDNNEPKCILSPRLLRIPNSSYKILGHIPDISGHGNHGVIHNSAYAEGSGVNEDGSYQFDGVDDFVAIPTLSSGGKQVLMKVNWNTTNSIIYDQRTNGGFAIYCSDYSSKNDPNTVPAYKGRNAGGTTYIDSILNENILASQLKGITHNIVEIISPLYQTGSLAPIIGKSFLNADYSQMALYDFMLFDEISTDDKIKELNEYVGIEAKVEKPDYYWDAYGKTNFDEDKATIQQRGIAVGDYDLTNYNHAYDKMSGYEGYSFKSFNDSQDSWNIRGDGTGVEIISRDGYSITVKKLVQNLDWQISNNEYRYPTILDKELPFKCRSNKSVGLIWKLKYKTEGATSDTTVTLINQQLTPNVPLEISLPYKTQDELTELGAVLTSVYYLLYFSNTTLEIGEEYTVEMLPLHPNGLVYDGVEDNSNNANVPALTDYTYIFKRELLGLDKNNGTASMYKGSFVPAGGRAFIADYYINAGGATDGTYGLSYGSSVKSPTLLTDKIVYGTKTSVNGVSVTPGSAVDDASLTLGKWDVNYKQMVFYKLILYPKTIPLLQINFLKNMMEKDEIIDLDNPIFKK